MKIRTDADAAAGDKRRDVRFAGVDDNAGPRSQLDIALTNAERPAQHIASALISEVDGIVFLQFVRMRSGCRAWPDRRATRKQQKMCGANLRDRSRESARSPIRTAKIDSLFDQMSMKRSLSRRSTTPWDGACETAAARERSHGSRSAVTPRPAVCPMVLSAPFSLPARSASARADSRRRTFM